MINEVWKGINGYEGLYEVSSFGRVRSVDRIINGNGKSSYLKKGTMLTPRANSYGYLTVVLCKNGEEKEYKVHRLVGMAFIPNPDNLPQINHKNEIKTDNSVSNLEWCNNAYNCNYGSHSKKIAEKLTNRVDQSKPVMQIDKNTKKIINEFPSINEASRQTGVADINITRVCKHMKGHYTAGGFIWEFA